MTIQRQYSLPNCKLILEGLTGDDPVNAAAARPLMSMVTHVECRLSGLEKSLIGGREFLESLMRAVSDYTQGYLSGLPHLTQRNRRDPLSTIQIHQIEKNLHRLSIDPQALDGTQSVNFPPPTQVDLTTVQLFDLVEAIDQLCADAQTAPDLALSLSSLPRRLVAPQEPVAKRVVPAVLGASSLAAAAALFFFLPAPEIRRPQPTSDATQQESPIASPNASPSPEAASPPPETTAASPSPISETSPSPNNTASNPASNDLDAIAQSAINISEPAELDRLTAELQRKLYTDWQAKPDPTFTQPLEYHVGVDETGQIVGYKFVNDPSLTYVNEIPLSDVQFPDSDTTAAAGQRSLAQFLVVFRPEGVVEISPWYGAPPETSGNSEIPIEPAPMELPQ
jgi:hypothetical protein